MVKISRILVMMVSSMVMTVVESSRSVDVDGDDSEILRRHLLANGLGLTPPMGSLMPLVTTGLSKLGYNYFNIDDCSAEIARDNKCQGRYAPSTMGISSRQQSENH
ncbi:PREDICTED: alpha-galactosidase 1-like isoform X1 [Camelina sativa]|uniref:Alpha-galactosidase 1-like isoform X1 n=1 Tax=Camelina sativa TaxID=90675 RepID=A0ABM1QU22_CAMSA|nr:PREDICTED: alpha-galactosidase 1-like isoform X1 [Camelina sativa]